MKRRRGDDAVKVSELDKTTLLPARLGEDRAQSASAPRGQPVSPRGRKFPFADVQQRRKKFTTVNAAGYHLSWSI
jgi:hypothetical protein